VDSQQKAETVSVFVLIQHKTCPQLWHKVLNMENKSYALLCDQLKAVRVQHHRKALKRLVCLPQEKEEGNPVIVDKLKFYMTVEFKLPRQKFDVIDQLRVHGDAAYDSVKWVDRLEIVEVFCNGLCMLKHVVCPPLYERKDFSENEENDKQARPQTLSFDDLIPCNHLTRWRVRLTVGFNPGLSLPEFLGATPSIRPDRWTLSVRGGTVDEHTQSKIRHWTPSTQCRVCAELLS